MTDVINLELLPKPEVIETLSFETVLAEMLADLQTRSPSFSALLESDPAYKILEVAAYREVLLRQRVNDAAHSVMVAYATDGDLDNLAALFNVQRLIVIHADNQAIPPVLQVMEPDSRLRRRIVLSLESATTAGSIGSYIAATMKVSAHIKDVAITSPVPGQVYITLLTNVVNDGDIGEADEQLKAQVLEQVSADDVRPLCDFVTVHSADIIQYTVTAELTFFNGPDINLVAEQATKKAREYVVNQHKLGYNITLSGLYAALHQQGVQNVVINSPETDIVIEPTQAAFCTAINLVVGGFDE